MYENKKLYSRNLLLRWRYSLCCYVRICYDYYWKVEEYYN